jgi:hypothetical protein
LILLALDLGTTTGWARGDTLTGSVVSGTASFRNGRYEGGGMRFLRFEQWLEKNFSADAIYFEEVRSHKGTDAAHVYGGLLAVLTSFCEKRHIPYQGVPVGTIKRHATGKGNASKEQMIAAARKRGWLPEDDNEADAQWILDFARSEQICDVANGEPS